MRKTKIICTLGPAVDSEEMIRKLIETGMDGARFNFSHGTHESHAAQLHYAVLAQISLCYSPLQGRLLTRYSPVRH